MRRNLAEMSAWTAMYSIFSRRRAKGHLTRINAVLRSCMESKKAG